MKKVIYLVNLVLAFIIARYEYNSGSDKTIIISSFLYVGLIGVNLLIGLFAQLNKSDIPALLLLGIVTGHLWDSAYLYLVSFTSDAIHVEDGCV